MTPEYAAPASPELILVKESGHGSPAPIEQESDFVRGLQSTLELSEQLTTMQRWLKQSLGIEALHYSHGGFQIKLELGALRNNHCEYRLSALKEELGEIRISRGRRFQEEELKQAEIILSHWVLPLRNALRYRQAVEAALTDPLTGAGNRVAMDSALERELALAARYNNALSLLIVDIDHFKRINDSFGHVAGDHVLRQVADTLRDVTRKTDMIFRYGGEEFVVVLSNTAAEGASIIAERIRDAIERLNLELGDQGVKLSVSLGLSSLRPKEALNALFGRADRALYKAKAAGRNCTAVEF